MTFFERYPKTQLAEMDKVFYGNKSSEYQANKFEMVRFGLQSELRNLIPSITEKELDHCLVYLHNAIEAALRESNKHEKVMAERVRANMQTAHNQLKNWK